ncbi:hypothetical protein BDY19DRAFT_998891 [Irpex rosettiformis]|uniref:Uncharacterized protein n=1 Tax=Irpex rosettiformis TaxID=378272 RepID=A0ACB8TM63_9APHY|nr:hypothetical protein BDY19DRAFT_998891 [Irpex rosettiformis]
MEFWSRSWVLTPSIRAGKPKAGLVVSHLVALGRRVRSGREAIQSGRTAYFLISHYESPPDHGGPLSLPPPCRERFLANLLPNETFCARQPIYESLQQLCIKFSPSCRFFPSFSKALIWTPPFTSLPYAVSAALRSALGCYIDILRISPLFTAIIGSYSCVSGATAPLEFVNNRVPPPSVYGVPLRIGRACLDERPVIDILPSQLPCALDRSTWLSTAQGLHAKKVACLQLTCHLSLEDFETINMTKKRTSVSSVKRNPPTKASSRPNTQASLITPDSVYPSFEGQVDQSVLRDLVPFPIIERSPKVPSIFEYHGSHPSHRVKYTGARTFVYLLDSSPEGKDFAYTLSESLRVPGGSLSAMCGELELFPGDAFLGRPISRGGDPAFDCLQILVGVVLDENLTPCMVNLLEHQDVWTHADIAEAVRELRVSRDDVLGSREDRVRTGKTAFELDPRAKPMKNGPQCFPLNNMVQQARQVEGPPAALKTVDNTSDAHQIRTHRLSLR